MFHVQFCIKTNAKHHSHTKSQKLKIEIVTIRNSDENQKVLFCYFHAH